MSNPNEMRLQKFLSSAGVCSRRTAEQWMLEGRVKVNGATCRELGIKVDPNRDTVEVDGSTVSLPSSHIYILLNKPAGHITSLSDPEGRPVVTDLLPANMPRVWPVGRLDWNTEGILLMTNDGKLTNLLTHPSHDVPKHYAVKVHGLLAPDSPQLEQLREGVDIGDDEPTRPAFVKVTGGTDRNTWLEVIIAEGRNRQVRRMFEAIDRPVMKLRRIGLGPLTIEGLHSGSFRSLSYDEVLALYEALEANVPEAAKPSKRAVKREQDANRRGGNKSAVRSVKNKGRGRGKGAPKGGAKSGGKSGGKGRSTSKGRPGNKKR